MILSPCLLDIRQIVLCNVPFPAYDIIRLLKNYAVQSNTGQKTKKSYGMRFFELFMI